MEEVAVIMRVSKMSVYRLVREGELDGKRFGRSIRIPERSLRAYLGDEGGTLPEPVRM